jgi:hypothetical protein
MFNFQNYGSLTCNSATHEKGYYVVFMNYEFVVYTSLVASMKLIWNTGAVLDTRATYNMIRQLKLSCVAPTKSDMAYNRQHHLTATSLSSQRIPTLELL